MRRVPGRLGLQRFSRSAWVGLMWMGLGCLPVWGVDPPGMALRHRLERGQTLAKVARLYCVPVEQVLSANSELVPEKIPTGAMIVIPEPPQGWAVYKVQSGETIEDICSRFGLPIGPTLFLNPGVDGRRLAAGQDLRVPRGTLSPDETSRAASPLEKDQVAVTADLAAPPGDRAAAPAPDRVATGASRAVGPPGLESPLTQAGAWVEVRLADGSRAWAPRSTLLTYSRAPLPAEQVVSLAQRFRGVGYVWGGQTPNGVDCSGYVQQVFSMAGYRVPRMADDQFQATLAVKEDEAQPGDLVFFTTYLPGPSHVGVYLGQGRFVHASSSKGVTETGLDDPYFAPRCLGIRRIKEWMPEAALKNPFPERPPGGMADPSPPAAPR